jgi:hypothetical protein
MDDSRGFGQATLPQGGREVGSRPAGAMGWLRTVPRRVKALITAAVGITTIVGVFMQLGVVHPPKPHSVRLLRPYAMVASSTAGASVDRSGKPVTYEARNASDGNADTAWRAEGDGRGVSLTATFGQPVHLTAVGLIPGYAKTDLKDGTNWFFQDRIIQQVEYVFSDGTTSRQSFKPLPTLQTIPVNVTTDSVTIRILATGAAHGRDYTAISEFQARGFSP